MIRRFRYVLGGEVLTFLPMGMIDALHRDSSITGAGGFSTFLREALGFLGGAVSVSSRTASTFLRGALGFLGGADSAFVSSRAATFLRETLVVVVVVVVVYGNINARWRWSWNWNWRSEDVRPRRLRTIIVS